MSFGRMLQAGRQWTVSPPGVMAWSRYFPGLLRRLHRPPLSDLTRVRRLAVLRPDGMGDLVLTTGMLRELRRQLPAAEIILICQQAWASWMRTCPWVDRVVDVSMTASAGFPEPKRLYELLRFVNRMWSLDPEVLVQPGTLYSYAASRALAWFSGAPVRMCWEDPHSGADTGGAFHTHCLPYPNRLHETEKCFSMLEAVGLRGEGGRLESWWTREDAYRGEELARHARGDRRTLVALGMAGSEPGKRWPRERYLHVIREVTAQRDTAFLVLGGSDVAGSCRWLSDQAPDAVTYAGDRLPLGSIWAAIAQCDLYLGNDSGFMHMAAAARTPVVAVIGLADGALPGTRGDPSHTGPLDTACRIVRPPAGAASDAHLDAALVPADAVTAATLELLQERGAV